MYIVFHLLFYVSPAIVASVAKTS